MDDLHEELIDMEATVTHLVQLVASDKEALADQMTRSAAAHHTHDKYRWPASSFHAVEELRHTLEDRERRLRGARAYLGELHAAIEREESGRG